MSETIEQNDENENSRNFQHGSKGLINPKIVNGIALAIITVCILIGVTASIMAIWNYADKDTLLRTVATVGIVILGTCLFAGVNRAFGD
jgi:cytochrome c biogenesis protein CcdA